MLITSWRVSGESHVCPCVLHLLDESVCGLSRGADVIDDDNPAPLEPCRINHHVILCRMLMVAAAMHLATLAHDLVDLPKKMPPTYPLYEVHRRQLTRESETAILYILTA